jgi:Tfp pilus assembly protein PilO
MTRLIIPIILIAAALGLFVLWVNPTYQAAQGLAAQVASYDDALNKSQELKSVRDQLLSRRNTFSQDDVNKLQEILPDNVDNIRLIIDINKIASLHNLTLQNVQLGSVSNSNNTQNALAAGASGSPIGSVDIGFSVTTNYDTMLAFLQDLEHSLRLIDVEKLSFTAAGADNDSYNFSIRTYWLH